MAVQIQPPRRVKLIALVAVATGLIGNGTGTLSSRQAMRELFCEVGRMTVAHTDVG
jgi:hypothetical protein